MESRDAEVFAAVRRPTRREWIVYGLILMIAVIVEVWIDREDLHRIPFM